jgi:hypothetical protein
MKCLAKAKLVSISAVTSKLATYRDQYVDGMIFVEIPELGFYDPNLILCRYGLSIPYLKVTAGTTLWVEPTIGDESRDWSRWIYTGFADSTTAATTTNNLIAIYQDANNYIILKSNEDIQAKAGGVIGLTSTGNIELKAGSDALEKTLLGETTKTELNKLKDDLADLISKYNAHTHTSAAPGVPTAPPAVSASSVTASFSSVLSAKVKAN